jgi:beta-mannosidase
VTPRAVALLVACACLGTSAAQAQNLTRQPLDQGWQFRLAPASKGAGEHADATGWMAAKVPGSAQTDLLALGKVPDPYYRDNEASLQWVGLADWEYKTQFDAGAKPAAGEHVELVFDGPDTFADVELNGKPLLKADNMFRQWRAPVGQLLHPGKNTLVVHLHSPITRLLPWLLKQPYALPGEFDSAFGDEPKGKQTSNYVRKANYQYGWDWGPRYVTLGIWQPVWLERWQGWKLEDFHVAQTKVEAYAADLQAQLDIRADKAGAADVRVTWAAPDGTRRDASQHVALTAGQNHLSVPVHIEHPQRWWPVGYGAPNLYHFDVTVSANGKDVATASRDTGLRKIELRRDKDQWGRGFAFVVNGVPIFAKGANLIPFDSFPSRVTDARMQSILQSAVDANMNMLRMWGGGTYQSDAFYAMADRMGLMIWQDFMFGGAIPPYEKAFRDNVRVEAFEQVRRLRDHPSIVLWAGNNEVQTGWESWPDREELRKAIPKQETARIEKGMRELFGHTLRSVVGELSPDVPYWASSPSTDYEGPANVQTDGDFHSWDVWSGSKPIAHYLDATPRFQSEYGLQSFPVMATLESFAKPEDMAAESTVMRAHQKFDKGNGNQRLLLYIRDGYGEPKDFPSFVHLSQLMQAEGIELAAEHLRSARPQSMGSLYWQLNDVWPGASWASVDYFGRWKALQYRARHFYAPVDVVPIRRDGSTKVSVVSDRTEPFDAQLRTRVMDFDGRVLRDDTKPVHVAALASSAVETTTDGGFLDKADPAHTVVAFDLVEHGKVVAHHLLYFAPARTLVLTKPGMEATLHKDGSSIILTVRAKSLARGVWIDFGDLDAKLSDNAFDLLPGESADIRVTGNNDIDALRRALVVESVVDWVKPPAH